MPTDSYKHLREWVLPGCFLTLRKSKNKIRNSLKYKLVIKLLKSKMHKINTHISEWLLYHHETWS